MPKSKKFCSKKKGKKRAGVVAVSAGVDIQLYIPMELSSSWEAHLKAIAVGLAFNNMLLK